MNERIYSFFEPFGAQVNRTFNMDAVNAVNNAFYFIHNAKFVRDENGQYYPEVVLKAEWPCGLPHIKDKWMRIIKANHDSMLSMLDFYSDLDNQHRRVMTEWVMENYDCGFHI